MSSETTPHHARLERSHNGWTGGQYSLLRVLFACSAVLYAADAWLGGAEGTVAQRWGALGLLTMVALPLALGVLDRVAAVALCVLLLLHRFLTPAPELLVAWPAFESVLLLHAFVRPAPYGAWSARGRMDPGGGWRLSDRLHDIAWLVVGLSHLLAGLASGMAMSWSLEAGVSAWVGVSVHLAFLPLALWRSTRPLALTLGLMSVAFGPLEGSVVLAIAAHLACLTPSWFTPASGPVEPLFYDGDCGLCHRAVRFCLAEDTQGRLFHYAPLEGEAFTSRVSADVRATLPDSLIILTAEGRVLCKSDAVVRCLMRLGGLWRLFAWCLRWTPRVLRDAAYDGIAGVRHRLFARPASACPLVPESLKGRFL